MDLKADASIHNRFDIRVIRDGRVIQEAYAENIVLDRMYTRVCNFSTYFDYIWFGTGTGTLSASRTTLFTSTSYKSAIAVEKVYSYPVSKITKKIQIMPEEYIGSIFTEVGISESTSAINTHALIKDAEGVNIGITKTALDLIEIYATVYIELQDNEDQSLYWQRPATNNNLLKYMINNSSMPSPPYISAHYNNRHNSDAKVTWYGDSTFTTSYTSNTALKKGTFGTTRLTVNQANMNIGAIGVENLCTQFLPALVNPQTYSCTKAFSTPLASNMYELPYGEVSNVVVSLDGVQLDTSAYTVDNYPTSVLLPEVMYPLEVYYGNFMRVFVYNNYIFNWINGNLSVTIFDNNSQIDNSIAISNAPIGCRCLGCSNTKALYYNTTSTKLTVYNLDIETLSIDLSSGINVAYSSALGNPFLALPNFTGTHIYILFSAYPSGYMFRYDSDSGTYITTGNSSGWGSRSGIMYWVSDNLMIGSYMESSSLINWGITSGGTNYTYNNGDPTVVYYQSGVLHFTLFSSSKYYRATIDVNTGVKSANVLAPGLNAYPYYEDTTRGLLYTQSVPIYQVAYDIYKLVDGVYISLNKVSSYGTTLYPYYFHHQRVIGESGVFLPMASYLNYNPTYKGAMLSNFRYYISLNTPLAEGSTLSVSYDTACIPKTTDYVLDVGFTLQFGEGTV